jgi:hypothetical protein
MKHVIVFATVITLLAVGAVFAVQIQPIKPGGPPVLQNPSPCQIACALDYRSAYNECNDAFRERQPDLSGGGW